MAALAVILLFAVSIISAIPFTAADTTASKDDPDFDSFDDTSVPPDNIEDTSVSVPPVTVANPGTTIYVPDDYAKIQWAIDNATAGDTIIVRDGTYTENVDVNKQLTIQSENGSASTIVNAATSDHVFDVKTNWVNLTGFTVTGATGWGKAGIYLKYADHCNISSNNASGNTFYGIYLYDGNYNDIVGNTVNNNGDKGIYVYDTNNNITDNVVENNGADGIYLASGSNNVAGNTANYNTKDGIDAHSSNNDIVGNTVNNNSENGIYAYYNNNDIVGNTANNNTKNGIKIYWCDYNNVTNNIANNNTKFGIDLYKADYNIVTGNIANDNEMGIHLSEADENEITNKSAGNTVMNNSKYGVYLYNSDDNEITCNLVAYNGEEGFYLGFGTSYTSTGNNISHNNIVENGAENTTSHGWEWNFHNKQSVNNVDADNNYWGTAVSSEIAASIWEDPGTVTYTPFATLPVPCAPMPPVPPKATLYFVPQHSSASRYCNETVVQVMADAPAGINAGQFAIDYNASCAKIVVVEFNPVWTTTGWNNTCYGPGLDWITFSTASDQGPGSIWLFNVTIHCISMTACKTDLNFTVGLNPAACPLQLNNTAGALDLETNNGTFTCGPDLTVASIDINPNCRSPDPLKPWGGLQNEIIVNESNEICAVIHNYGQGNVLADQSFDVCFDADGVKIGCEEVTGGLAAGENKTVCINWTPNCTNYPVMPGYPAQSLPVTINVTADCNCTAACPSCPDDGSQGRISELNESNNKLPKVIPAEDWYDCYGTAYKCRSGVVNMGYKSKNLDCTLTEEPLTFFEYDQLYGGVVHNVSGVKTHLLPGYTDTRIHHIDIPTNMTIKKARLYVYWYDYWSNWKDYPVIGGCMANLSVNFNGTDFMPDAKYTDQKGFGCANAPKGTYAYDVTSEVPGSGDYTAIVNNLEPPFDGNTTTLLGQMLLVVYEDPAKDPANHKQLWITEGCDLLMAADAAHQPKYNFCVTPEEATATATFPGAIDEFATGAKLITVVSQGMEDGNKMLFNDVVVKTDAWNASSEAGPQSTPSFYASRINVEEVDINLSLLAPSDNTVGFLDNGTMGMQASTAILVVRKPCEPGIEVNKTVWDTVNETWVKEITAHVSDTVRFRIGIHNSGTCCNLTNIVVNDTLSPSLTYDDNAIPFEPALVDNVYQWTFATLNVSETITIEFDAHANSPGMDCNIANATARCNKTGELVADGDEACVKILGPIESYGGIHKRNVRHACRAFDGPNRKGAHMFRNSSIAIPLKETIPECEKVSVWVRRAGLHLPTFEVFVSSDGKDWTLIGTETCTSPKWTRFDFTGNWDDVKYIEILKDGTRKRPRKMHLDAVHAEGWS